MSERARAVGYAYLVVWLTCATAAWGQDTGFTRAEMRAFLLSAEVIGSQETGTGTTKPLRLTLSDGTRTHDGLFQTIDDSAPIRRVNGTRELNFVDSYRYNIAAHELAELIGLGHMIPVTVKRVWNRKTGSLSWWIDDVMFDEATRRNERARPEDMQRWVEQLGRMRVFGALVHDTDRNQTNQLYTTDWNLYMIDFSRAFRLWGKIRRPADLQWIDAAVFARLKTLTEAELEPAVGEHLTGPELSAVLTRRDLLVEHFQQLIDQKGEALVLY